MKHGQKGMTAAFIHFIHFIHGIETRHPLILSYIHSYRVSSTISWAKETVK
jgi:hypothetical protein